MRRPIVAKRAAAVRRREEVEGSPDDFPIRQEIDLAVASREAMPDGEGYGAADPMIEVLVDAGVLADERLVRSERHVLDPRLAGYSVVIQIEQP